MRTGLQLLSYSIERPEPLFDEIYSKDLLVITGAAEAPNALMRANLAILDRITAYKVSLADRDEDACERHVDEILGVLGTPGINNSEFTCFWAVNDASFSLYKSYSPSEKRHFLHKMIRLYLEARHELYQSHGYSATTLQTLADSFAHKRTGPQGQQKVCPQLDMMGIGHRGSSGGRSAYYLLPDAGDAKLFDALLVERNVRFEWRTVRSKQPDFAIVKGDSLFIVEHKHMKEFGGGQDKQVVEITDFVVQTEPDAKGVVSYVSYLDGVLFNRIFCAPTGTGKAAKQSEKVRQALERTPTNYFVNTAGFEALLEDICPR